MAEARSARLTDAKAIDAATRLLTLQVEDGRPLEFVGGQYIIVNTGIPLPGGKVAKRAYSILSPDSDQHRFQIAVRRIGTGPGSNFMHALAVGSELTFSGPWGKFFPTDHESASTTLVFATDTGITAALGLLRSRRFQNALDSTRAIWFVDSAEIEMGALSFVNENLPRDVLSVISSTVPVHARDRAAVAALLVREQWPRPRPERAFLSGDGAVLIPLGEDLKAMGVPESAIRMECFFNNPNRKAP